MSPAPVFVRIPGSHNPGTRLRLVTWLRDPGSVLILGQVTQYGNPYLICISVYLDAWVLICFEISNAKAMPMCYSARFMLSLSWWNNILVVADPDNSQLVSDSSIYYLHILNNYRFGRVIKFLFIVETTWRSSNRNTRYTLTFQTSAPYILKVITTTYCKITHWSFFLGYFPWRQGWFNTFRLGWHQPEGNLQGQNTLPHVN